MRLTSWIGWAVAVTFAAVGLTAAGPGRMPPPPRPAAHTTVLPPSKGPHLPFAASGCWTPRATDLRRLEADLPLPLAGYYRQSLGIIRGGRRLIFINGFSAGVAPGFTGGKDDRRPLLPRCLRPAHAAVRGGRAAETTKRIMST